MRVFDIILIICEYCSVAALILGSFKYLYFVIGVFKTRVFPKTENRHRYAVVIAARNEEPVIGNLIDSIKAQDYPSDLVTVFVVADNCDDGTASVARSKGCVCYERNDREHATKGFALQYLFRQIEKDFSIQSFEGYFIFDSDNLLAPDYISRMNEAFDTGEKIITSYRASKNFDSNWISASYGLYWIKTILSQHRARSVFDLATRIQGTGYLVASELLKDGWNYTCLTEDRMLSADAVIKGCPITYNEKAVFYDEQPITLRIAFRQRIRWAKGHLQTFRMCGLPLFKSIFKSKNFHDGFMSYDMFHICFPRSIFISFRKIIVWLCNIIVILYGNNDFAKVASYVYAVGFSFLKSYPLNSLIPLYIFIRENKYIPKLSIWKKLWYSLTFPLFDLFGRLAMVIALFSHVEWKTIPHTIDTQIEEMPSGKKETAVK